MFAETLYDKLWNDHIVHQQRDGTTLLYINRHLVHEVTSPQAFEGLRMAQRGLWSAAANLAVPDHNVPTTDLAQGITDPVSKIQVDTLHQNCKDFNITEFHMGDPRQGIVHVIGPEQGATLPGMTVVCGDSHTSTHGALGALAFGIGTSDVEHVLATQCILLKKSKNMKIEVKGKLANNMSGKDIVLAIIGKIGTAGGTGHTIEFCGETIRHLSIEGRMTICNMAIEAGARAGLVAVDEHTINYVKGRPFSPQSNHWQQAETLWQNLHSDATATFDKSVFIDISEVMPQVTWGTSPEMVTGIEGEVPDPESETDPVRAEGIRHALAYMDLTPGTQITDIPLDKVFIGSCTNARIEDIRAAATMIKGQKVAPNIKLAMVVPGSGLVKRQAEAEGLHTLFINAGFEWRAPGCSMCLAMNADKLLAGERCASTSNRNFEGRQGQGGRTHLVSPAMAAAAAIAGCFVDVRKIDASL